MEISSVRQLQALVRGRRSDLGLSQQALAQRSGVSRKWVSDFERGQIPGAELTLVVRVLAALDIVLDARPGDVANGRGPDAAPAPHGDDIDLDEVLARHVIR